MFGLNAFIQDVDRVKRKKVSQRNYLNNDLITKSHSHLNTEILIRILDKKSMKKNMNLIRLLIAKKKLFNSINN